MNSEGNKWRSRWVRWMQAWQVRAEEAGLAGLVDTLRAGFQPLAPLAAQVLWIAQPTVALFGEAEAVSALADLLEHPNTLDHSTPSEGV